MAGFVRKVLKSGLGILISRVFGMVRDVLVAAFYGANALTDSFFMAFAIPNLFRAFFVEGALSAVFVPIISDKMSSHGQRAADAYLTSLFLAVLFTMSVVVGISLMFPEQLASLLMPGFSGSHEALEPTAKMITILMPYLIFIFICSLFTGYLNLKGSYFIPSVSTALLNISMIAGAWIGYKQSGNIYILCYGVIVGGVIHLAAMFGYAWYKGYRPTLGSGFDIDAGKTFHLVIPSLISVSGTQLNFLVGRVVASFLSSGSISYLYYANRLFQFPLGIFASAVGTVTLTEISVANSAGEFKHRNELINKAINAILLVMLPAGAGLIVLADPIVRLIYGRMAFGDADVAATAFALRMYSAGMLFYSFINVFSRVYYSDKDVKTPLYSALAGFAINAGLSYLLMKPMGHGGVALAASVAAFVNALWLYFGLKRYKYEIAGNFAFILKIFLSVILMSAIIYLLDRLVVNVLISVAVGIVSYFILLAFMGINPKGVLR